MLYTFEGFGFVPDILASGEVVCSHRGQGKGGECDGLMGWKLPGNNVRVAANMG